MEEHKLTVKDNIKAVEEACIDLVDIREVHIKAMHRLVAERTGLVDILMEDILEVHILVKDMLEVMVGIVLEDTMLDINLVLVVVVDINQVGIMLNYWSTF